MDHEIHRALHAHGCAGRIDSFSAPSPRYQWFGQDWNTLLDIDWTVESVSGGPEAHFFYQPALEAAMEERIGQLDGITVLAGQEAIGFAQDDHSVTLDIKDRTHGTPRQIHADFLVVDVAVNPGVTLDIPSAGQFCHPQRPTTFVPGGIKDGRVVRRWEFMRMPHETLEHFDDPRYAWSLLERWVRPDQGEFLRQAVYTFRSLIAEQWRAGRAFLIGDAAHLTPPFLGQGMCSGVRDAINLGWRLDLVLRGAAAEAALQHYETERKPHITRLIEIAMYLGKIICVSDPEEAAARDRAFLDGSAPPPPPFPHLLHGTLAEGSALAGRLSPHAMVRCRRVELRLDRLTGPNFVLLARHRALLDQAQSAAPEVAKRLNLKPIYLAASDEEDARGVVDLTGKLTRFLDDNHIDAYIARPDGYLFGATARGTPVDELMRALADSLPSASAVPAPVPAWAAA
jgi:3-(3-hydroxy-phenyl)propionate hydroxylase